MAVESIYLNRFFEYLNENNIRYCVMNNYHDYPDIIPSDIDFTIEPGLFSRLDKFVKEFADAEGLSIVQKIWHGYQKCAYILSPISVTERFRLQLDFFVDFTAKGYWKLISHEEMVRTARSYKNFFIPSPEIESVFLLMRRIIKNDAVEAKLEEIRGFQKASPGMHYDIEKIFGSRMAAFFGTFSELTPAQFAEKIKESRSFLREYSRERSTLMYRVAYKLKECPRLLERAVYPVGLSVCFLSPDGGGKTSVIEGVTRLVEGSFHGIQKVYWRPRLLPPMGRLKFWNPSVEIEVNPDPHGHAPQHPAKSLIRFFYYFMDYVLGYPLRVYPWKVKKSVVFFDRYYYDFLVDLHRYRMSVPKWLPKMLLGLVPAPDLVVVLSCPPDVMAQRKKELTMEELTRQHQTYADLARSLPNCVVIDSNRPLDVVCEDIASRMLEKKSAIAKKSLHC